MAANQIIPIGAMCETGPTTGTLSSDSGRDSSEVADISPGSRTGTSQALVVSLKPSPILQASALIVPAPIYLLSVPRSPRHAVIAVIPVNASAKNRFGIIGPA